MNIKSFSRMKSYREDGRVRVILKLELPCADGEADEFNSFYERLAEEYMSLIKDFSHSSEHGSRPTVVSVRWSIIAQEDIKKKRKYARVIVIKRVANVNVGGEIRRAEYIDLYDTQTCLFVG